MLLCRFRNRTSSTLHIACCMVMVAGTVWDLLAVACICNSIESRTLRIESGMF
jgi:hypothetical protein